jgi:hypothetical protein
MMSLMTGIAPCPLRILLSSPELALFEDGVVDWGGDIREGEGSLFEGEWREAHISHCPRLPGTLIDVL